MGKCLLAKVSAKWWKLCLHAILTNIVSDNLVVIYYTLKAVCHEMFDPFFSWFEPIWARINSLKYIFEFGFDFAAIFDHKVISAVCNIPRRCTLWCESHRGHKIKFLTCLWLILKRQSGEILSGVNTSVMKEKIWSIKYWFIRNFFYLTLWLNILAKSKANSKIL